MDNCHYCARPSPWEGRLPPNWTARHICRSFDSLWALTSGFTKRAHHVWIGGGFRMEDHLRNIWAWHRYPHAVSLMHMPPAAFRSVQV